MSEQSISQPLFEEYLAVVTAEPSSPHLRDRVHEAVALAPAMHRKRVASLLGVAGVTAVLLGGVAIHLVRNANTGVDATGGSIPGPIAVGGDYPFHMVYDPKINASVYFDDTNTWLLDSSGWHELKGAKNPPSAQPNYNANAQSHFNTYTNMAYDADSGKVLMVGIDVSGSGQFSAPTTWEFDGKNWSEIRTVHTASNTFGGGNNGSSFVFDPIHHVSVLLGTSIAPDFNKAPTSTPTSIFDGKNWRSGPAIPFGAVNLAYDENIHQVIAITNAKGLGEQDMRTYAFTGSAWTLVNTAHQLPVAPLGVTYDPALGKVVVLGYVTDSSKTQTWAFDGKDWKNLTPKSSPGTNLEAVGLVYDSARNQVVALGIGTPQNAPGNGTWEYNGITWAPIK